MFGVAGISDETSWACGTSTSTVLEVDAFDGWCPGFSDDFGGVVSGAAGLPAGTDDGVDPVAGPTKVSAPAGRLSRINARF